MRKPEPTKDDKESSLIKRVANGDREAFRELYSICERRLYAYLIKMTGNQADAEDLVIEVMLAVWQAAKTFKGNSRLSTWILGIAHNKAMNTISKTGRQTTTELEQAADLASAEPDPHSRQVEREQHERISTALQQLSAEHRVVIELTFYHGRSYAEIAQIAGCPVNTVKTRMFYAKQHLKQILAAEGIEGGF
ncbi:MAG TPA: sigma-70 family RNA polymerase sigma factor [Blastocatellia bacterium]|nr:sigma-70 family RNA polymerase sigma factor [Blastocatellia bacterium]